MLSQENCCPEMSIVGRYFEAIAAYWREIYGRHDVNAVIHQERRALVLSLLEELAIPPRFDVLEVGCGAGLTSIALAQRGYAVKATDLVAPMLELTHQAAEEAGVGHLIETKQCDIHRLPFRNDSFMLVMAIGVLPWLPSLNEPMREMVRVLRPDGYLIVTTDNYWRLSYVLHPFAWARLIGIRIPDRLRFWKLHNQPLTTSYSIRDFNARLPRLGLEKVFGKTFGFGPFWMLNRLLPQAFEVKLHHGLQRLAESGVPLFRSTGAQYITVSKKIREPMLSTIRETSTLTDAGTVLRTSAWYGDESFTLPLPPEWSLVVHWPRTPPPLTEAQIIEGLERPVGQTRISELCRGKSKPLVIVDDLNRPTPVYRVLPILLKQFRDAGIQGRAVRILVATGTHGRPSHASVAKKVGPVAASECEIIIHNPEIDLERIGKTSFGTPVSVNKEVTSSDLVIGIGGVYPNQTAGFGGGSKLVLGVLGFRSIMQLHYRHSGMGWGRSSDNNSFRRDLDEIARMVNLRTSISMHIDANREVIRLTCGDPFLTYNGEVEFARKKFTVPPPGDAEVVICNAYPSDISLTSVHMKGITPLERCVAGASRIVVASCPEGVGHHGLFPCVNRPKLYRLRHIARRLAIMKSQDLFRKVAGRVHIERESVVRNPIWLYRPSNPWADLPFRSGEVQISKSWAEIVETIRSEQSGKQHLNVVLYPCAPLQVLE